MLSKIMKKNMEIIMFQIKKINHLILKCKTILVLLKIYSIEFDLFI